jgi:hypothetical protein
MICLNVFFLLYPLNVIHIIPIVIARMLLPISLFKTISENRLKGREPAKYFCAPVKVV